MINFIIYLLTFIMGTFLGSFCTLAVYRIPLKQDITHERSYCVNCNHKLSVLDLMPVLSYIFLGGKCRYCKQKIRPRYLILEIFFGLTFMLFIMSLKIDFLSIQIPNLAEITFFCLYLVTLFLIAGIDKERKNINNQVLSFGIITSILYIVYLYVVHINIYRYVIYIIIIAIIMVFKKIYKLNNYILQIVLLILLMSIFTGTYNIIITIILTILTLLFAKTIDKKKIAEYPIGFVMCIYNILILIIQNFMNI